MFAFRLAPLAAIAAAALLAACGGQGSTPAVSSAPVGAGGAIRDAAVKITASPSKLNFTTTTTLKLSISEANYKGTFTLKMTPGGIVKLSKSKVKGPKATITVTALSAGKTTITAADSSKNKKAVPVTVTQGVIIIQ